MIIIKLGLFPQILILLILIATCLSYNFNTSSSNEIIIKNQLTNVAPICLTIPPALWCSCKKIAEQCGFAEACKQHATASWKKPIHLTLLYESLCPDCQHFIANNLFYIVENSAIKDYVRLELVPYGNAKRLSVSTFTFY